MKIGNLRKDRLQRVKRCLVTMLNIIIMGVFCIFAEFMRLPIYTSIIMLILIVVFSLNEIVKLDKKSYDEGLEILKTVNIKDLEKDTKMFVWYNIFAVLCMIVVVIYEFWNHTRQGIPCLFLYFRKKITKTIQTKI